jgi:hypothetical protein
MKILSVFYKHKDGGFNKRLKRPYLALANRDIAVFEKKPASKKGFQAKVNNLIDRDEYG